MAGVTNNRKRKYKKKHQQQTHLRLSTVLLGLLSSFRLSRIQSKFCYIWTSSFMPRPLWSRGFDLSIDNISFRK